MKALRFSDVRIGQTKSRIYRLTPQVYRQFLSAFGDLNPMHTDDAFARRRGFKARVMHGAILNGFISHFIGMRFPGTNALLQSVSIQYRQPVHLNDALKLTCEVEHVSAATRTLSLVLAFKRGASSRPVATAKVQVGMTA